MSIVCLGIDHRIAPLAVLERFCVPDEVLPKLLAAVRAPAAVREVAVLSTCNRSEVYAVVDGFHDGVGALREVLESFHDAPADALRVRVERDAIEHLVAVAAGLESAVIGEPQILRQVRGAFRAAQDEASVGPVLSALFRAAIKAGRRARADTRIASSQTSLAAAGLGLARGALGSLRGRTVLVNGAGTMGSVAARAAAEEGARVLVASRTVEHARSLADRVGGEAVPLARGIAEADLVVTSTASTSPVITRAQLAERARRLFIVDLAVPRDVDAASAALPQVTVWDVADLRASVAPADPVAVAEARGIVADATTRFETWRRAHGLAPLLASLIRRAEGIRAAEIERLGIGEDERATVEAVTRTIVNKLLHDPVVALTEHAGSREGETLARSVRRLFDLD